MTRQAMTQLRVASDSPSAPARILIGIHVPHIEKTPAVQPAVMCCLETTRAWQDMHPVVRGVYNCGSICIVLEVDAGADSAPLLQLDLVDDGSATSDICFKFTDALRDDADTLNSDAGTACALATEWGGGGLTLAITIPPADVDTVFGVLPERCRAAVRRENRRCKNRSSRTTPDRCYCHLDLDKFPDWQGGGDV